MGSFSCLLSHFYQPAPRPQGHEYRWVWSLTCTQISVYIWIKSNFKTCFTFPQVLLSLTWMPAICPLWLRKWLMNCWTRMRSVPVITVTWWEFSWWNAGNPYNIFLLQDAKFLNTTAHSICPSSQTEGPVVTPFGDIQMQTFSVTKKVQIWGRLCRLLYVYLFIYCQWSRVTCFTTLLVLSAERQLWQCRGFNCPLRYA